MYFTDAREELRVQIRRFLDRGVKPHLAKWDETMFPDFAAFVELSQIWPVLKLGFQPLSGLPLLAGDAAYVLGALAAGP